MAHCCGSSDVQCFLAWTMANTYKGNSVNLNTRSRENGDTAPAKVQAHARNNASLEKPPSPPTSTLVSLPHIRHSRAWSFA